MCNCVAYYMPSGQQLASVSGLNRRMVGHLGRTILPDQLFCHMGASLIYFLPAPVINSRAMRWDRTSIRGLISARLDRTPRLLTSKPRKSSSMNPSMATCALRKSASYILSAASSLSKPPATSVSILARVLSSRRNCRASLSAKNALVPHPT